MSEAIAPVEAIPVGGGVIFAERGVVVTQPVAGTFAAFDTTCPHLGCAVRAVAAGTVNCFCHGSRFRISDGAVVGGPAKEPLTRREVVVEAGLISVANLPS